MKRRNILLTVVLFAFLFGCASPSSPSLPSAASQEIEARERFASRTEDRYRQAFRVLISAEGQQKDILEITVMANVSPYDAPTIAEIYSTEDLKKDAKALKFKQIRIKGGSINITSPDTINKTIDLR